MSELDKAVSEYYYALEPALGNQGLSIDVLEYRTPHVVTQNPIVTQRAVVDTEARALAKVEVFRGRRREYERLRLVYGGIVL